MASGSGVKQDAFGISGTANNEGQAAYSTAMPLYTQMALNPQGYTPKQMADLQTASSQGLGGALASAVGYGNQQAAATGNAGGYTAAMDQASRQAMQQQSANNLAIQNQNVNLQNQQKAQGLAGLAGIYDTGTQASINALNAANGAKTPFWQNFLLQGVQSAGQVGAAAVGG